MKIIRNALNVDGNYSPIIEMDSPYVPDGWLPVASRVDTSAMQTYVGFVTLTIANGIVTGLTPNTAAWEAWKAAHPETPTEPDPTTQTQIALAELAETESAHDLENKLALAELAETIGGISNG